MKTSTIIIGFCWAAFGAVGTLVMLTGIHVSGKGGVVSTTLVCSVGAVCVFAGVGLMAGRAFGWWLTIALTTLMGVFWGWLATTSTYTEWRTLGRVSFDDGLLLTKLVPPVVCVVFLVAVLVDRPSKWHRIGRPERLTAKG